jgi:hypothetical protein
MKLNFTPFFTSLPKYISCNGYCAIKNGKKLILYSLVLMLLLNIHGLTAQFGVGCACVAASAKFSFAE